MILLPTRAVVHLVRGRARARVSVRVRVRVRVRVKVRVPSCTTESMSSFSSLLHFSRGGSASRSGMALGHALRSFFWILHSPSAALGSLGSALPSLTCSGFEFRVRVRVRVRVGVRVRAEVGLG